jgi:hypothetical protein
MRVLFPYAVVFLILAMVTMIFVKHGDHPKELDEINPEHKTEETEIN